MPTNYGLLGANMPQGYASLLGNQDLALALLANSGYQPTRQTFGQTLGNSMLQAQQMGQQRDQDAMKRQYMEAQIAAMRAPPERKPIAVIGPTGEPEYVAEQDAIGRKPFAAMNRAEAPASIQEFQLAQSQGYKGTFEQWLRAKAQFTPLNPSFQNIGGVPTLAQPTNRQGGVLLNPLSTPGAEQAGAAGLAGASATGAASAKRVQTQIDTGLDAADAIATVRRGRQLLDSIQTGGIDAAKLAATNFFGVTGADEAELSGNLGKAVLAQLRTTFGAQFTEREGQRLAEIEAGFGKSTEGNKRLLEQAEKILDRAARRGLRAAKDSGDSFSAEEIEKSLNFTLDPNAQPSNAPPVGTIKNGYRFKGGNPADQNSWEKL